MVIINFSKLNKVFVKFKIKICGKIIFIKTIENPSSNYYFRCEVINGSACCMQ